MCQPRGVPRNMGTVGCGCGCGCGPLLRHFLSSKEEQERLETYEDQLKNELAGVKERIKDLTGK